MLGKVVRFVEAAALPIDMELALADTIANPVEAHVDRFGALLLDGVVGDAGSSAVVGLEGRRRLGVAEFFERNANRTGFFAIVEEGSEFGFGRTRKDFAHDLAEDADGTVRRGWRIVWIGRLVGMRWAAAEVVIASGARARFGGSQVGGVAFDPEDHVASDETHGGVRMGGTIVQEVGDGIHG